MFSDNDSKEHRKISRKSTIKENMSHRFRQLTHQEGVMITKRRPYWEPIKHEVSLKTFNFKGGGGFSEFLKGFLPLGGTNISIPGGVNMVNDGGVMVEDSVDVFSFNLGEERAIIPS
jgi:hypothetical protein